MYSRLMVWLFACGTQVIPDSIGGLKSLELLDVSSNLLESLPDSIGLLVNLKVLNVSGNKLKALPESIAGCRYSIFLLGVLHFSLSNTNNEPSLIPPGIGHMNLIALLCLIKNIFS